MYKDVHVMLMHILWKRSYTWNVAYHCIPLLNCTCTHNNMYYCLNKPIIINHQTFACQDSILYNYADWYICQFYKIWYWLFLYCNDSYQKSHRCQWNIDVHLLQTILTNHLHTDGDTERRQSRKEVSHDQLETLKASSHQCLTVGRGSWNDTVHKKTI